jgi:hypothetical protein
MERGKNFAVTSLYDQSTPLAPDRDVRHARGGLPVFRGHQPLGAAAAD